MKHILIFFSIIFLSNICYAQDNIIVLVTDKNNSATLSRNAEEQFNSREVKEFLTKNQYKFVRYYGQDLDKEWHDKWNIKWYPTVIHLRKIDGQWYRFRVLDPKVENFHILKFLGISARRFIDNIDLSRENRPRIIPGGS